MTIYYQKGFIIGYTDYLLKELHIFFGDNHEED